MLSAQAHTDALLGAKYTRRTSSTLHVADQCMRQVSDLDRLLVCSRKQLWSLPIEGYTVHRACTSADIKDLDRVLRVT